MKRCKCKKQCLYYHTRNYILVDTFVTHLISFAVLYGDNFCARKRI